jgi:hypothetical protein
VQQPRSAGIWLSRSRPLNSARSTSCGKGWLLAHLECERRAKPASAQKNASVGFMHGRPRRWRG